MELESVRNTVARIAALEKKLECLKAMTLPQRELDGLPKGRGQSSMPERIAVRIVDTERELKAIRVSLDETKDKLGCAILDRVQEPFTATALFLRYVGCYTLERVADALQTSRKAVYRHIKRGKTDFYN